MPNYHPKKENLKPNTTESWRPNDEPLTEQIRISIPPSYKAKLDQLSPKERISLIRQAVCEAIVQYTVKPKSETDKQESV